MISKIKKAPLEVEEKEAQKIPGVRDILRTYVESCMRQTADPSVYLLASQGGIIYPDENDNILLTDYGMINYAWMNGLEGISKERMEEDLADYLVENIDYCLANFETFLNRGILVVPDYRKISAKANILPSAVNLEMNLPLEVNQADGDVLEIETFSTQLKSSLGKMLEEVNDLPLPAVDISNLVNSPYRPTIFPYDESVVIYSLANENIAEPLAFIFAVRDDSPKNKNPVLLFIADKTFKTGNVWEETLTAEDVNDDLLTFSSDSDIFPIAGDGAINVKLNAPGTYEVTFIVEDGRGGKDDQEVMITVLEEEDR